MGETISRQDAEQMAATAIIAEERDKERRALEGASSAQRDVTEFTRQQALALQESRNAQKLIQENPFLSIDEKTILQIPLIQDEINNLNQEIANGKDLLDGGTLDPAQYARVSAEVNNLETHVTELGFKLKTLSFGGGLRAELVQWVNSFGAASHAVSGIITGTLNTAIGSTSQALTDLIFKTGNWKQTFASAARSIIQNIIQIALQYVVSQLVMAAIDKITGGQGNQRSISDATTLAAAWAPAALSVSIATEGSGTITGTAAYLAALVVAEGAAIGFSSAGGSSGGGRGGYKKGGFTGYGDEDEVAGPVHRREYVLDQETVDLLGVEWLQKLQQAATGGRDNLPPHPIFGPRQPLIHDIGGPFKEGRSPDRPGGSETAAPWAPPYQPLVHKMHRGGPVGVDIPPANYQPPPPIQTGVVPQPNGWFQYWQNGVQTGLISPNGQWFSVSPATAGPFPSSVPTSGLPTDSSAPEGPPLWGEGGEPIVEAPGGTWIPISQPPGPSITISAGEPGAWFQAPDGTIYYNGGNVTWVYDQNWNYLSTLGGPDNPFAGAVAGGDIFHDTTTAGPAAAGPEDTSPGWFDIDNLGWPTDEAPAAAATPVVTPIAGSSFDPFYAPVGGFDPRSTNSINVQTPAVLLSHGGFGSNISDPSFFLEHPELAAQMDRYTGQNPTGIYGGIDKIRNLSDALYWVGHMAEHYAGPGPALGLHLPKALPIAAKGQHPLHQPRHSGGPIEDDPRFNFADLAHDEVPFIGLTDEFVHRREAVQHYGMERMHALNEMRIPIQQLRMHEGGALGVASGNGMTRDGSAEPVINVEVEVHTWSDQEEAIRKYNESPAARKLFKRAMQRNRL